MKQTQMISQFAQWAEAGGAMPPGEALAALAAVIDHLDMYSDTYEADRVTLMSLGAAMWQLDQAQA